VTEPVVQATDSTSADGALLVAAYPYQPQVSPAAPSVPEWAIVLDRDKPWWLAWRALLLDQRAYNTVVQSLGPLKKGFLALLAILGIVLVARLVGWGLDYLTAPRLDSLQALVQNFITGLPWYQAEAQRTREFVAQFAQSYGLSWEGVRAALGIPTPLNQGVGIGTLILNTLVAWFAFGTVAHWCARWFGGAGTWKETLGAIALAYAPLLLLVVEAIPGAAVPLGLLFLLELVGKYQAIKSAHRLTPGYNLASVLLPYLIAGVLALVVVLIGGAFGLEQIPYFDTGLRAFGAFGAFGGSGR
jgi:hypothetical protein